MANGQAMVMRSIYLPLELDEKMRVVAFSQRVSKGEFIRRALGAVMEQYDVPVPIRESRVGGQIPEDEIHGVPVSEVLPYSSSLKE